MVDMTSTTAGRQPDGLRADATRNRARIIDAARRMFAKHGLDVPMAEIAECAGVGVGTLYRRFASRDELIAAIFTANMASYADAAEEALADPDPWHGLTRLLHRMCQWQADDQGFSDVLITAQPQAKHVEAERQRAYRAVTELISRAKAAGQVRADFTAEDIAMLLIANAGLISVTGDVAPDAWRRFATLMISSYRADNTEPAPAPPTARAMYGVMRRRQTQRPAGNP
ncbi:transcriptional regulator, TetR family [Micromonospora rhizosphaerae]|uniref:Transcriptional regulator, TetR family n=2 Tax=Micromonospora rhizosphaerae TaxID=568872 RepID=A0A1C6RHS3_9ACTN|nr:transcriptional regulator, TetR family [Micromonospora rhizosphaerae]